MISPPFALPLGGRQMVARGLHLSRCAATDWWPGQAQGCRMVATQRQAFGPGLFAPRPASSLDRVSSFFLGLRANSLRRELRGEYEQALDARSGSPVGSDVLSDGMKRSGGDGLAIVGTLTQPL